MNAKIVVLAGDGIGPEVTAEGVRALEAVATNIRPQVHVRSTGLRGRVHRH